MELSVAIQAKVEVTPSNWNFGFQPTKTKKTGSQSLQGFEAYEGGDL